MAEFITKPSVSDVYKQLKATIGRIRTISGFFSDKCAAGPITIKQAQEFMLDLRTTLDQATDRATFYPVGVISRHAVAEENKPDYDPVTAYQGVVTAAIAVLDLMAAALPSKLGRSLEGYEVIEQTFSPAETAPLRTLLAALIAAIGNPAQR